MPPTVTKKLLPVKKFGSDEEDFDLNSAFDIDDDEDGVKVGGKRKLKKLKGQIIKKKVKKFKNDVSYKY